MNCMRCGKETEDKDVFCPECLEEMKRYPVKPGTLIHIPNRPAPDPNRQAKKRRELTVEEQLNNAQHMIQALFITVLCLLGALALTGTMLIFSLSNSVEQPEETLPPKERNYTIITPAEE